MKMPYRSRSNLLLWLLVLSVFVFVVYAWVGPLAHGPLTTRQGDIYYPALADAFLSGQLHLKTPPDPRLHTLEKAWVVVPDGIPRLPEGVYFQGKYYLYFGALPAVILFIPFRLLTGVFPTDHFAVFIFCTAGWSVGAAVLVWAWRRWFSELSRAWLALGLLLQAFVSRAIFLLQEPMVHGVPISCAFFFAMLALACGAWTLTRPFPSSRAVGLALTSLTWACAVASRPNYIFSLPVVGFFWIRLVWLEHGERRLSPGVLSRLTACTVLPAAAIGLVMITYNYARFGQYTEFGLRYHIGSVDQTDLKIFGAFNLLPNWRLFFLSFPDAPHFSAYFPFFPGWIGYWGFLCSSPFLILIAALPLVLWRARWRQDGTWVTFSLTLAAGFLLNTLSILLLTILMGVPERYAPDMLPFAILLSLLIALSLLVDARRSPSVWQYRVVGVVVVVLGIVSLANSGVAIAMRSDPVARLPQLAQAANALVAKVEGWRGVHYGPMTLRLRFHDFSVGSREPLLVSGNGRDIVFVEYVAPDRIRLGLDHLGSVALASDTLPIRAGQEHLVELDLGNLYPPPEHPLFAGVPARTAHALRHRLRIALDGVTVLQLGCVYYPTHPGDIFLGRDGPDAARRFSGTIVSSAQHGLPRLDTLARPGLRNPVRLTAVFPRFENHHSEPLLSSGAWGRGDLLYVTYVGPNRLRFGHDSHGAGAILSEIVDYVPERPVTLDIALPSLQPDHDPDRPAPLVVRFADHIVFDHLRSFHAAAPHEFFLGFNGSNSSQSGQLFQGRILRVESLDGPILPPVDQFGAGSGPVRLTLRFPAFHSVRSEPLLVTGSGGAADAFYVQYLDDKHIRIGYDHWGRGGALSLPIAVDYEAFHVVELHLGSLYPAPTDRAWGHVAEADRRAAWERVAVRLNGETVLEARESAYPTTPELIRVGQNAIGLSTCEPAFTGKISAQERLGTNPPP